ncbi:MAG TPA: sugar ABC transporter permease [Fervidobacterium sp.]|nr:sugar ABC transporter permease [Fervidobacterium sp.]
MPHMHIKKQFIPWLLLAPSLVYLLIFMGLPIIGTAKLAFESDEGWLGNFKILFSSKDFQNALWNTLLLAVIVIPIQLVLSIFLAILVNKKFKGHQTLLYIIASPLALSDITAALMSYSIFAPNGYLNRILLSINWIERPIYFFGYMFKSKEMLVIILTEVWRATPLVFVMILAGLQSINKEYIEAAEVFGFSSWQRLWKITLPLLKPSILSALLIRTLFAFQLFGVVWLLAGRDIKVLAGETYYWYVFMNNKNVASVYALIIALLTFVVGWFYIKTIRSEHLEEGAR